MTLTGPNEAQDAGRPAEPVQPAVRDIMAGAVALLDLELARFRGAEPFHDDVTCIGLGVQ